MPSFSHPPSLSPTQVSFVESFYRVSDQPDAVDDYLSFLTDDVHFVMGLNAVQGAGAVRKIRETMWGGVATRRHKPELVVASEDGKIFMLHGTVDYGLRNGKTVDNVGWAAKMEFAEGSELKMKRYQVWLDGTPLSTALKDQAAEGK
ncbi:hypothetical protein JCM10207_006397 [Rhodosporidiobolus poonsookiae]